MTDESTIATTLADGVYTITIDRPDQRNALSARGVLDICAALDTANERDDVRAVIVTGNGSAFCVGADVSAGPSTFKGNGASPGVASARETGGILALKLFACRKPVIGAVNGDAAGIGATMLLPMDARLASRSARFGFVFTRRGLVPETCSSWFLPRIVGISTALQWALSGRLIDADEALSAGLIDQISEPDELLGDAATLARSMITNTAPVSVSTTRLMLWRGLTMSHPMEAHRMESAIIRARGASADAHEGITAFLERRSADFPGLPSADMTPFDKWWEEPPFATENDDITTGVGPSHARRSPDDGQ